MVPTKLTCAYEKRNFILFFRSVDYEVKLWDFAGMDSSLKSFRSLRPCESHVIKSLEFSSTGDKLLVVAGSAQVAIANIEFIQTKNVSLFNAVFVTQSRKS